MRYMHNRSGVVLPYNAELISDTNLGFVECNVSGIPKERVSDKDIPVILDEPPQHVVIPEAETTSPDTFGKRGRPRKVGGE